MVCCVATVVAVVVVVVLVTVVAVRVVTAVAVVMVVAVVVVAVVVVTSWQGRRAGSWGIALGTGARHTSTAVGTHRCARPRLRVAAELVHLQGNQSKAAAARLADPRVVGDRLHQIVFDVKPHERVACCVGVPQVGGNSRDLVVREVELLQQRHVLECAGLDKGNLVLIKVGILHAGQAIERGGSELGYCVYS